MSERKVPRSSAAAVACLPMVDCESFAVEGGRSSIQIGKMDPSRVATRKIAEHCGVSDKTVAAQRAKMSGSEIPNLTDQRRLGLDGKMYPARRDSFREEATQSPAEPSDPWHDSDEGEEPAAAPAKRALALRPTMSDNKIAAHCGVSPHTVASVRSGATMQNAKSAPVLRTGADGRTINTANIGRRADPREEATQSPAEPSDPWHDSDEGEEPAAAPAKRALALRPNLSDRKIAEHCGVSHTMVSGIRSKMSSGKVCQIDTPRVATRNGVEYEIRTAGINANRRADPREEAAKCVGGTLHI